MSSKFFTSGAIAIGVCASLFTASNAFADPPPMCNAIQALNTGGGSFSTTPAPATIYVTGSSALKPIIAALAPSIFTATSPQRPATIVYLSQGSCVGVQSIAAGVQLPASDTTKTPITNLASYWDPNSAQVADATHTLHEQNCVIPAGTTVDIGASDVFAESCGYNIANETGIADFQGPIQSMTFAVNASSKEHTISAQAAYLTFGLHNVAPWIVPSHIFRRSATSGTQVMIGAAIGLAPNSWTTSSVAGGSSDVVYAGLTSGLSTQADFDNAIGILSADYSAKAGVRTLGYQHFGQRCAYTPDILTGDKANTREGRYAIWGPIHLLTQIDSSGFAKNLQARDFISYLLGTTPPPAGIDLIRLSQQLDVVPPCAMKVQRKSEMGPILPFTPTQSCTCAYDTAAGVASSAGSCKACTANSDCTGTQSCNFGYCE